MKYNNPAYPYSSQQDQRIAVQVADILLTAWGMAPLNEEERQAQAIRGYANLTGAPHEEFSYTLQDAIAHKRMNRERKQRAGVSQYVRQLRCRGTRSMRERRRMLKFA